ncbi:SGNH/GDSL hydrolase family protein [Sphingomonas sp. 1P08PE]|uniref:SGNH/GDSL hydrolase family protein n=1 Tax=Sphingomonas sp. 1P08PE TaxID=554122 RepID=UPI0039A2905C
MRSIQIGYGAALALLLGATAVPATAQEQPYSRLFVFGDSLVDSGNAQTLRALAKGEDPAPASLGYFAGRFSNGYNFADYLSVGINGGPATASERGGLNFSVGGAQAAEVAGDASPSFLEQIASFRSSGQQFGDDALVLVTLGGNDVRAQLSALGTTPGYQPTLAPAVAALTAGLGELYASGARNFVVTGLPDIGQIPAVTSIGSSALATAGTQLSSGLNDAFAQVVAGFGRTTGANASFFDLFSYQKTLYADPGAYGLPVALDRRNPCLVPPSPASGCEDNVYFDSIHPTSQIHFAIAQGIGNQIGVAVVPEPATWAMMLLGFGMAATALRYRRRQMRVAFA